MEAPPNSQALRVILRGAVREAGMGVFTGREGGDKLGPESPGGEGGQLEGLAETGGGMSRCQTPAAGDEGGRAAGVVG